MLNFQMNETFQQPARWHDGKTILFSRCSFYYGSATFLFIIWNNPLALLSFIVILTPSSRPANEPLTHAMSFTLRGLQSGSVYEAIVQAKNRYGWNEVSGSLSCSSKVLKFEI